MYTEITGDLIKLALNGEFDMITHGCNCFCTMGAGIAVPMAKTFNCNNFDKESLLNKGDINKLGTIDYQVQNINEHQYLIVINSYTQYNYGSKYGIPLDYEALTLCFRKINKIFKGKHIGLPQIGCGLAGGDWNKVKEIIQKEFTECKVTVVIYG